MREQDISRFWDKVDKKDIGCWNFLGGINKSGYGNFWLDGRIVSAHRVAWKISNSINIPKGKSILHHCDNKKCCRPSHLYCGNHSDNMRDYCSRLMDKDLNKGERNPASKLTLQDVKDIKELYATGKYSYSMIASIYGLAPTYPHSIIKGKRWKDV